jgi:hypothetical protein
MLAALLNTPKSFEEWQQFARDHRDSHDRIRKAIKSKYNIELTDYIVEPLSEPSFKQFLQNNASLHTDMNGVLKSQSSDLLDVNFDDLQKLETWISLHYQEHQNAEQILGIGG